MPKCKICKAEYERKAPFQQWCSSDCGYKLARKKQKNKEEKKRLQRKRQDKKRLEELMTRSQWYTKLQLYVNKYIKLRDKDEPCCTCGTMNPNIKYDAGHFIAVGRGGASPTRFELTNIHRQCSVNCNQHGSGMRLEYEKFIINKYGQEHLDWLKGKHPTLKEQFPHYEDVKAEIEKFKKMIKQLQD